MASSTIPCGVCELRQITKSSEIWCSECEEGLCIQCKEHHGLSKGTRKHVVIPISDYQELPDFITEIKQVCEKHDEKYQLYCKTHDSPCCRKCHIEFHKQCQDVTPLEDIVYNTKNSTAFGEITTSLEDLVENMKRIRMDREDNLDQITKKRIQIEEKIKTFRLEINSHLDRLQQKITEELSQSEKKVKTQIKTLTRTVAEKEEQIKNCRVIVQKIAMHATDLQTFLGMKQIESEIIQNEKFIESLIDPEIINRTMLSYKIDANMGTLVSYLKSFGEIVVESKPAEVKLSVRKQSQAQIMARSTKVSYEHINLILQRTVHLKNGINGCSISPCGKIAITRYQYPAKVILINKAGSVEGAINLTTSFARDVTFIDDNTIAVTADDDKGIELIDIKTNTSKKRIKSLYSCYGITYTNGHLFYCTKENGLQKVNLSNSEITTVIKFKFRRLSYVSSFNNKLYYTCDESSVGCCDINGVSIWRISDESMFSRTDGIAVDEHGNVFVANYAKSSISLISPDGKQHRNLSLPDNTISDPLGLCYDKTKNVLVVTNQSGVILFFRVNN